MWNSKDRLLIRTEQQADYRRVEEITRAAFSYPERVERGGIGCPYEHWMVHTLRERDGIPELSLVAELNNNIVGHIICSHSEVRTSDNILPVLNFGPLSVLPAFQRKGVGKALIKHMIWKAADLGYGAILFFGRPEYYPQFGFKEASVWQISDANGCNYPAFMGMELILGYLSNAKGGKYYESDIYDDERNRMQVKAFDNLYFASLDNMESTEEINSVKNTSKAAKDTALEVLSFAQEKREGQRFSYLFEPLKRHGD